MLTFVELRKDLPQGARADWACNLIIIDLP
jgi:hypothetical protein